MYLYIVLLSLGGFSCAVHIFLLVLFTTAQHPVINVINVASVLTYMVVLVLIHLRRFNVAGLIAAMEVLIYVTLHSYFLGINSYILCNCALVLIMQVIVPYSTERTRIVVTGMVLLTVIGCLVMSFNVPVTVTLQPLMERIFLFSNALVLVMGTTSVLYMDSIAKLIIARTREALLVDITNQANTDALTGLYNRRYADSFFDQMTPADGFTCVAMIDIDDFKQVNDTYGHACGDEVLRFLADFLHANLRRSDVIFRWGGEEFLVALHGAPLASAYTAFNNLRSRLAATDIATSAGPLRITITIGLAPLDMRRVFESIEESDAKLYEGKRGNKNTVVI